MVHASDSNAVFDAAFRLLEAERLDIMQQIAPLQARLKEVHGTQASLLKRINPDHTSHLTTPHRSTSQKYAKISVRWAILDLLNDSEGMTTAEISEALTAAGIQTRATNFTNNVSAVLTTTMLKDHQEVEQLTDGSGKWKLTLTGVSAISYLRSTEKFQRACGSRPAEARKV